MDLDKLLKKLIKDEVHLHFSKSGGHGGQNVNKRKTKAELYFNVQDSHLLDEDQKDMILEKAGHRLHHHEKILIFTCQEERYQKANKVKVLHHFRQFMEEVLTPESERVATCVPQEEKEKRLHDKKKQSEKKHRRRRHHLDDA